MDDIRSNEANSRNLFPIFDWNNFISFVGFILGWHFRGAGFESQHSPVRIGLLPFVGGLYKLSLVFTVYGSV